MATIKTLDDLFVDELRDVYNVESQLIKALRKLARRAHHTALADAFTAHANETKAQLAALEAIFAIVKHKPRGRHSAGVAGIIDDGRELTDEIKKSPLRDVALIGSARRAEHYEIAAYASLVALAAALDLGDAAARLREILAQEVVMDQKLETLGTELLAAARETAAEG